MSHTRNTLTVLTALCISCLALAFQHSACVEDWDEQPSMWNARDALSLSPAWLSKQPPAQSASIRTTLLELASTQRKTTLQHTPQHSAHTPLTLSNDLDHMLEENGAPPLIASVATMHAGDVLARSCTLPAHMFSTSNTPPPFPPLHPFSWSLSSQLQKTTSPRIFAYLIHTVTLCLEHDQHTPKRPLIFRAVSSAPYLLRVWPDQGVVYINPALLWMIEPTYQSPHHASTQALRTQEHAVNEGFDDLDECIRSVRSYCEICGDARNAQGETQCTSTPLFSGQDSMQDCAALRYEIPNGFLRYCVNRYLQDSDRVGACVKRSELSDGRPIGDGCGGDEPVDSANALRGVFGGFVDPSTSKTCLSALSACIEQPFPPVENPPDPIEDENPCNCSGD